MAPRCHLLPEVACALDAGTIGFEAARLVSRVADRDTIRAWLDRASRRTTKHLEEEVEAAESIARASGLAHAATTPPDQDTLDAYVALERAMLDGTAANLLVHGGPLSGDASPRLGDGAGQMSGGAGQMSGDGGQMSGGAGQMSGGGGQMSGGALGSDAGGVKLRPGAGRVALRLRLRADLVAFWRNVARLFRDAGEPGELADFLVRTFWHTWLGRDGSARVAYQDVYERERFRCASPVCSNRDLTPHHLVFRSRGGGDARDNLIGLCVTCHLELVHGGRLRAEPPAPDVRWTLGRAALLTVAGRERRGTDARSVTPGGACHSGDRVR